MTTQINQVRIQSDSSPEKIFEEDCQQGDWQKHIVQFVQPFPVSSQEIRVIITANDLRIGNYGGAPNPAAVGIAYEVTQTGFTLAARNSECRRGITAFYWMAVAETPGVQDEGPIDLRMGILQRKYFQPNCQPDDSQSWKDVRYSTPLDHSTVVLLTASNLNIPILQDVPAVGIVQNSSGNAFTLTACNSDISGGFCAFYYVSLSRETEGRHDLWVDTGKVEEKRFSRHGSAGDWQFWDIAFRESFLVPPYVLVTAYNPRRYEEDHNSAPVGIARDVTTSGFTLAARNSACGGGYAGFYWVAIGCAKGCG